MDKSNLADVQDTGSRAFRIRDPIHDYIDIAEHEKEIVDDPIIQRLRYISQNAFLHLVFPEVRTSRFTHSLGAMHLVSRFLPACVKQSSQNVIRRIGRSFLKHLEDVGVPPEQFDTFLGENALLAHRFLPHRTAEEVRLAWVAMEAAARLAALFHDVGHLPFSHDLEPVAEFYVKRAKLSFPAGKGKLHEHVGRLIALHYAEVNKQSGTKAQVMQSLIKLAVTIVTATKGQKCNPVIAWLHDMIDGDVDVDRADFLLRDGRALGFSFTEYDLGRLIDNLCVISDKGRTFKWAMDIRGVSALESFYLSRSRMYSIAMRHRKVVAAALSLRHVSREMLNAKGNKFGDKFSELMRDLFDRTRTPPRSEILRNFSQLDDVYWLDELRRFSKEHDRSLGEATRRNLTTAALELLLSRRNSLSNLWKHQTDRRDLNQVIKRLPEGALENRQVRQQMETALRNKGVLFHVHKKDPRPSLRVVKKKGASRYTISRVSTINKQLRAMWEGELHAHAFAPKGSGISREQVLRALEQTLQPESNTGRNAAKPKTSVKLAKPASPVKAAKRLSKKKKKTPTRNVRGKKKKKTPTRSVRGK